MVKTVAIVSLSAGTLGESFVKHELDTGVKRLAEYGLNVRFLPHALSGIEHIKNHPEDWKGKILLLESSEEYMPPGKYRRALEYFKAARIFGAVSGVLVGKSMDRKYESEYKAALTDVIADPMLPVACNINIGHALPRCILPFGVDAAVNVNAQKITFA